MESLSHLGVPNKLLKLQFLGCKILYDDERMVTNLSEISVSVTSDEEKKRYISLLSDNLLVLRAKAGLTQSQLANYIGVSRQTYSSIECKQKSMSWSVYMSLIFVFDSITKTHDFLRMIKVFPETLLSKLNSGEETSK